MTHGGQDVDAPYVSSMDKEAMVRARDGMSLSQKRRPDAATRDVGGSWGCHARRSESDGKRPEPRGFTCARRKQKVTDRQTERANSQTEAAGRQLAVGTGGDKEGKGVRRVEMDGDGGRRGETGPRWGHTARCTDGVSQD